ncbi:hypothetical protein IFM89_015724 [Coptis chinensis]|uniref:POX domain-containing protein n=1 Tax=Coptis chinensis TaxID=261450 RepID=A0A835LV60_9MAGN|nr:hypothetical protein IFM89_015724 [Coptis chinensis]
MRAATHVPPPSLKNNNFLANTQGTNTVQSMSKGFPQGINISFSNGLEDQHHQQQSHIAQQSRREKLRVQGFETPPPSLDVEPGGMPVYETGGMWSEMFNFPSGTASTSNELLDNQISANYRLQREAATPVGAVAGEWYGSRQGIVGGIGSMGPLLGDSKQHNNNSDSRDSIAQNHQISSLNADSAAAMQLFLMNPQPRSPSPSPQQTSTSSPLHFLPHPNQHTFHSSGAGFGTSPIPPAHFQWMSSSATGGDNTASQLNKIGAAIENQGLSLTLSTSLQNLEAAKAEEFRMGEDGVFYYDQGISANSSTAFHLKNMGSTSGSTHNQGLHLQGVVAQNQHFGMRSSMGIVNLLRNSKYVKAAQELLEEFCSVGRAHLKNNRLARNNSSVNPNQASSSIGGGGNGSSSTSTTKDLPPLSAADRIDYQRKKTKLLSMLDEAYSITLTSHTVEQVDRRYNHYCEQMQVVVNSFDSVMGFGAAIPYTALAQKAMSRHFRCLKDAITAQLKHTCELLGDKDSAGGSGVTKGETPRLKLLEQSLRQQRVFHQMGMMEQEAWRPQRGLPERSVNILRAWLFEHFLHPYPSDADKHLLARQTGLSRNQ